MIPLSVIFLNPKILRYPNLGNEMWNSENRRDFIRLASKIAHKLKNRTVV